MMSAMARHGLLVCCGWVGGVGWGWGAVLKWRGSKCVRALVGGAAARRRLCVIVCGARRVGLLASSPPPLVDPALPLPDGLFPLPSLPLHPTGHTFLAGVLGNWLVCLAVWQGNMARDFAGKAIGVWLPDAAFVSMGGWRPGGEGTPGMVWEASRLCA